VDGLYADRDTGGDDRFRSEHIPAGTWTFHIARAYVKQPVPPTFEATIEEGKTTEVEWTLPK